MSQALFKMHLKLCSKLMRICYHSYLKTTTVGLSAVQVMALSAKQVTLREPQSLVISCCLIALSMLVVVSPLLSACVKAPHVLTVPRSKVNLKMVVSGMSRLNGSLEASATQLADLITNQYGEQMLRPGTMSLVDFGSSIVTVFTKLFYRKRVKDDLC